MTDIERPKTTWKAVIDGACDTIVERLGARGYALMAIVPLLLAAHAYITKEAGPLMEPLIGVEGWLFVLGIGVGGNLIAAICLYGEDGDGA